MPNDPTEHDKPIRRDMFFSGLVQGVGFRYTTAQVAARFAVTGYVQNLSDGRVKVVAEGTPGELGRFRDAIDQAMTGHIKTASVSETPATNEFPGFAIAL